MSRSQAESPNDREWMGPCIRFQTCQEQAQPGTYNHRPGPQATQPRRSLVLMEHGRTAVHALSTSRTTPRPLPTVSKLHRRSLLLKEHGGTAVHTLSTSQTTPPQFSIFCQQPSRVGTLQLSLARASSNLTPRCRDRPNEPASTSADLRRFDTTTPTSKPQERNTAHNFPGGAL